MMILVFQFTLGLLYANAGEWIVHRYILHALGRKPQSFWAYHLHDHHKACLRNGMLDPGYQKLDCSQLNTQTKELLFLGGIILLHIPTLFAFPFFAGAVYFSLALYYYKHYRAHMDPTWAKQHMRWHYEHHLGGDINANWCVTWPWFDYLCGTRIKYDSLD